MPAIANTTVISNFAAIARLDLLQACFGTLYISDMVWHEIQDGLLQGYTFYANIETQIFPFTETGWIHLTALNTPEEFQTFVDLLAGLHSGEASCAAIASHRHWTFLTDDRTARHRSKTLRISISGTLGILLLLTNQHIVTVAEVDTLLHSMINAGYFSPVTSLQEILSS